MSQLALMPDAAPSYDTSLSQHFTPPELSAQLIRWCGAINPKSILEPSAGSGALVDAVTGRWPVAEVLACELDPRWVSHLTERHSRGHVEVISGDFMRIGFAMERFDLSVLNPPYEDGQACAFLRRCMDLSQRVVGVFQTSILQGVANVETIWSDGEWSWHIAMLKRRPRFSGSDGTAQRDFCAVKGRRRGHQRRETRIEWWG